MTLETDATPSTGGNENYYEVLGLAPGATADEIEAAYEDLSAMFAAGKVPASRQEYARKQRTRLAAAYATLADPEQRVAYDQRREAGPAPARDSGPAAEPATAADIFAPAEPATAVPAGVAPPPGPLVLPWEQAPTEVPLSEPLGVAAAAGPVTPTGVAPPATGHGQGDSADTADEGAGLAYPEDEEDLDLAYEDDADEEDSDLAYEEDSDDEDAGEEPDEPQPPGPMVARYVPAAPAVLAAASVKRPAGPLPASGLLPPTEAARRPGAPPPAGIRVEPARPAARAGQSPAPAPRAGGVLLPSRREAALIAARQTSAPPAPAPPTRAASAPRRPAAQQDRPVEYEEDIRPRGRMAPAPPVRRRRSRKATNQFAYQVMVLVIAMVLVVGTAASVLGGTITNGGTSVQPTANPLDLVTTGNTLVTQGNWASAEQVFRQALQIQPTNVNAMLGLVHVYEGRHNPTDAGQAQSYAQQIIKTDPNSAAAKEAIGVLTSFSLTPQASPTPPGPAGPTSIQVAPALTNSGVLTTAPAGAPGAVGTPKP